MFPEAVLHMLFDGQFPQASDLTSATLARPGEISTTIPVAID